MNVELIGAQKVVSVFDKKEYITYHVFFGIPVSEDDGIGVKPMDFKVQYEKYREILENADLNSVIDISFERAYDKNGKMKLILTSIKY